MFGGLLSQDRGCSRCMVVISKNSKTPYCGPCQKYLSETPAKTLPHPPEKRLTRKEFSDIIENSKLSKKIKKIYQDRLAKLKIKGEQ